MNTSIDLSQENASPDITSHERLAAALSYPILIVALGALLASYNHKTPFVRYHALQGLMINLILYATSAAASWTLILACLPLVLWPVTVYWGFQAYQGNYHIIPLLTPLLKWSGWIQDSPTTDPMDATTSA